MCTTIFARFVIAEGGQVGRAGRVETTPATLELFAQGPCRGSSGCARGERKRVGDRPDHRAGCQSGCACQPEGEQEGLDIHEQPSVGSRDSILESGAVVTVEPGLYYFGVGGVRIEDMVLVTKSGCRNLTKFPKDLKSLEIR